MSISKEDILKLYKPSPIDEKLINKPALDIFDLLLVKESQPPNKEKKEITNSMYFNNVEENWHKSNSNNIEFNRGGNFKPKEENVDIKIENIYLFNKKLNIPEDIKSFYVKNSNYNNFMGPFSSKEIEEQYKNKKINSLFEFRPIDIFMFKNKQLFTFENLKILNDENWINNIGNNSLLKYSIVLNPFQIENNQEKENKSNEKLKKNIFEKNIESKQNEEKETKTEENKEKKEEEKKNKINNEKKEEKLETLGHLLIRFVTFYGFDFNYKKLKISIRNGCFLIERNDEYKNILSIEIFQEISQDIGRNCFQYKKVLEFFKYARDSLLCHDLNVESYLKTIIFPDEFLRERTLKYK